MTPHDVLQRLDDIDHQAQRLLRETGYDDYGDPDRRLFPMPSDPDGRYLWNAAVDLLGPFPELHEELRYLKKPLHGVHLLKRLPGGRYGYHDKNGWTHSFSCGSFLEFLQPDPEGHPCWRRARMEHDGSDYFLHGAIDLPMEGLTVRERW